MGLPAFEDEHHYESVKSRLGESLIRLHRSLEQTQQQELQSDSLFLAWQQKWSNRREQITSRLEVIESQLEVLSQKQADRPTLSLVGLFDDEIEG